MRDYCHIAKGISVLEMRPWKSTHIVSIQENGFLIGVIIHGDVSRNGCQVG